jgi:transcriptional regulator with XRE-family HTH domain
MLSRMADNEFGKRLRAARRAKGRSQREIAELFGVKRESVALWESGRTMPQAGKLRRLAAYLGISLDALVASEKMVVSGKPDKTSQGTPDNKPPDFELLAAIDGVLDEIVEAGGKFTPKTRGRARELLYYLSHHEGKVPERTIIERVLKLVT